ncbi:fimbrial protein [Luteibacter flocculans]|uniref:Fimbrial protein n=1 Tax=Luteibacter flocculans TaxID=2780091 RepID=A0ABY4T3F4_9GAMM|nr:fimbrial protein [Luteibacter flocculans]URL58690.1 fimbrial protein [Luteibacter flocculans]
MKSRTAARLVAAAFALSFACTSQAKGCLTHPAINSPQTVSFGVIRVPSAAADGVVLAERSTTGSTGEFTCHDPTRISNLGIFQTPSALGDHIYETNVPGVGVRIYFRHKYYGDVPAPDYLKIGWLIKDELRGASVQLIKTGPIERGGTLHTGRLAHAGYDGKVQAWADLVDARIEPELPTCVIQSRSVQFDLGKVDGADLAARGHSAWVAAPLVVSECKHATALRLTFNGEADLDAPSLFRLNGFDAARGVAVELRSSELDLPLVPNETRPIELRAWQSLHQHEFRARYRVTDSTLTPGPANAHITVNVAYR